MTQIRFPVIPNHLLFLFCLILDIRMKNCGKGISTKRLGIFLSFRTKVFYLLYICTILHCSKMFSNFQKKNLFPFFSFLPCHKKLVREKLPNYILGLALSKSRLLKWCELLLYNQWWSGDPSPCSSDFSLEYLLWKGNSQEFTKKLKKSPSPIHLKKTDFGWWYPDTCNPKGRRKGNSLIIDIYP